MDKEELAARLKKLNLTNAEMERETGFAKNNLGKYLKTPELLSDRWVEKLASYLRLKEETGPEMEKKFEEWLEKPENVEYRRRLATALFERGLVIEKVQPSGEKQMISPESSEGGKVLNLLDKLDPLEAKLKAIRAEKTPDHIKTPLGIKSWNFDQQKKIKAIQDQIEDIRNNKII